MSEPKLRQYIGQRVLRREDDRFLRGTGKFVGDVRREGMIEAVFVRSPVPFGRLTGAGTSEALAMPGVVAIYTADDLSDMTVGLSRNPKLRNTPQPILAHDTLRFVGEAVTIVLARNRYEAEDAAELVEVEYEPLEPREVPIFTGIDDDIVFRDALVVGPLEDAFARAEHVVDVDYTQARQIACPMECRGCVAEFDSTGGYLDFWGSTQSPHLLQATLAEKLGLSLDKVRVHITDVGGGFGLKIPTHTEEIAIARAAMLSGRPVRWLEDRYENLIAAPQSRDQKIGAELAIDGEGQFLGLRTNILGDCGAYSFNSGTALTEAFRAARYMPGPYRMDAYGYNVAIRLTNKPPISPYRGVGQVAAQCARELLIDRAARAIGADRFELRRANMLRSSDSSVTSVLGWKLSDISFIETLELGRRELEDVLASAASPDDGWLRGVGISPCIEPSLAGDGRTQVSGVEAPRAQDVARAALNPDGRVVISVGTPSIGQGIETTLAQIAADASGAPLDDIDIAWTDTVQTPRSAAGVLGSRGAVMGGGAVGSAAQKLRVQLLEVASMLLQQDADRLQLCDGVISGIGASGSTITFAELARALPGETRFVAEAAYDAERASYSNACAVAVVAVHRATGKVRVDHIAAAEDAGTMLNPLVVEGQFIGGALQGVGMALSEQLKFDETGMPLTATLLDYCLPTASDTPAFRLAHVETPSAYTWAGVKGIGETGTLAVTAAIAAAVEDALAPIGAFVVRLPLTPEEVWLRIKCPRETVQ